MQADSEDTEIHSVSISSMKRPIQPLQELFHERSSPDGNLPLNEDQSKGLLLQKELLKREAQ